MAYTAITTSCRDVYWKYFTWESWNQNWNQASRAIVRFAVKNLKKFARKISSMSVDVDKRMIAQIIGLFSIFKMTQDFQGLGKTIGVIFLKRIYTILKKVFDLSNFFFF